MLYYLVSHTHWDREWYHPAERFRQRLVALIDELLDAPADGATFLLDGQTIVLEDYLEVRPERAAEVAAAMREGRIEAGPWFVLADELIPGGEALVRNLLAGRRTLRSMRATAPPVLYCPDSFGHPAALPALALGFDMPLVILWRGLGSARGPGSGVIWWRAPGGERVLLYHLTRAGYESASSLPADETLTRARWQSILREFGSRRNVGVELLLNGADHHARQRHLAQATEALRAAAAPDEITASSLGRFAGELTRRAAASAGVPEMTGELRDSYGYAWTLQGTLATRTPQKRRYVLRERDLVRDVEPWAAVATFRGAASRRHLARAAWRPLLLCQPHDTLCGCSIDQVARAMDGRLESVAAQAQGLREGALFDLIGHEPEAARVGQAHWRPMIVVRNRAPRARSGVALVEVTMKLADVPIGIGSKVPDVSVVGATAGTFLDTSISHERTESPRHYPDNDAVARFHTSIWVKDVPAYGVLSLPMDAEPEAPPTAEAVVAKRREVSNGNITLSWDASGRITLADAIARRTIRNLVEWESRVDVGDLYTPAIRAARLKGRLRGTRIIHRGPMTGVVEQRWEFVARGERVDVRLRFVLDAGARFLRFGILGDNAARDHRLRLRVNSDVSTSRTVADAAFGPVERVPLKVSRADAKMEMPVRTAPLHRYVSLFNAKRGATLFADGLTEYENADDGFVVTVLRAVGELSRNNLPERPGHAGWPEATPEAQCIGPFDAEFGLLLHGPRSAATTDVIERAADDVLFPLVGETLRSALVVPPPIHGVSLEGVGLSFSCAKESEDGEWLLLRCVNLLDQPVAGAWRLAKPLQEAKVARLDETPLTPLQVAGDRVAILAPPRGVLTVLVR